MKISIFALHLGVGGVEKYVLTLANMLSEEHDVEIISTYKLSETPAFYVSPTVCIKYLLEDIKPNKEEFRRALQAKNIISIFLEGFKSIKTLFLKRVKNVEAIKQCNSQVIISTRIFHNKLIGKYSSNEIIKITGEHNHHNYNKKYIKKVVKSCKGFQYFIPISKELSSDYEMMMQRIGVETRYIRFCIDENSNHMSPKLDGENLISIGRLSPEKGMGDLILLFDKLYADNRHLRLHIIGDGEERVSIEELIIEKELQDKVFLYGYRDKEFIYKLLPEMSLYIMTSYTESFGIVLLEAMSCGIPCLAYSSAQGAHEIIKNGYNGWLINDRNEMEMVKRIQQILNDRKTLECLSKNSFETAERYSYQNTKNEWLKLMKEISERR